MDKETLIFLSIFLTVVILGLSCVFPKNERKGIILVGFGFVIFLGLAALCIWGVKEVSKDAPNWLGMTVAFSAYSILLTSFGYFFRYQSEKSNQVRENQLNEPVDESKP
mgnify:CR=1 FL=1